MVDTVLSCIFPLHGIQELTDEDLNKNKYYLYLNELKDFKQSIIIFGNDSL